MALKVETIRTLTCDECGEVFRDTVNQETTPFRVVWTYPTVTDEDGTTHEERVATVQYYQGAYSSLDLPPGWVGHDAIEPPLEDATVSCEVCSAK